MSEQKSVGWPQLLAKANQKSTDIVYLRAKNLPLDIVCGDQVYEYRSVYAPLLRRSRFARAHEESGRIKHEYAFHILMNNREEESTVRVAVAGPQLVSRIQEVLNTAEAMSPGQLPSIHLHATGSGMNTEYFAEFLGDTVPISTWDGYIDQVASLPLDKVVEKAYELNEEEVVAVPVEPGVSGANMN